MYYISFLIIIYIYNNMIYNIDNIIIIISQYKYLFILLNIINILFIFYYRILYYII